MGAIVLLLEDNVTAIPGEESRQTVQIVNTGSVVDHFRLDIVGDAKDWISVEPTEANVFPDQCVAAEIVFKPAKSTALAAGEARFALRVMSSEDIEGSVVEEATVAVGAFTDFAVTLRPGTGRGRFSGRYHVVVDNHGNAPLAARLFASDPDAALRKAFKHDEVEVARGKGVVVPLRVRPRRLLWRGADVSLPFQVLVVGGEDDQERTAEGTLVKAAVVSAGASAFVLALAAAIMAFMALWFLVLQPTVESEARKQANDPSGQEPGGGGGSPGAGGGKGPKGGTTGGASEAPSGGGAGGGGSPHPDEPPPPDGGKGGEQGDTGGKSGGGGENPPEGESGGSGGADGGGSRAAGFRIEADATASEDFNTAARYTVPDGTTMYISDIFFENTAGDTGIVRLQRDDDVLMQLGLDSYRDLDRHFNKPLEFKAGENVVLAVRCNVPGGQGTDAGSSCTPAAFFSGRAAIRKP
ncbi:hypothetical protein [Streptomyces cucumeris]|uniref:COG1470 family protein n=1 Tax=Streptomyces cucumeris TaxID=2962890 RepID=UPI0020C918E1|nr:hypothetical protein [Streptomyces sp. NEAU-Y11]MCP9213155.1 hypothetical protein [Streptomyces sp. NEAU-Y11]